MPRISPPSKQRRSCGLTWFTKSYRAGFLGVNGSSRPGRDSQPYGLGLLIGAAISAVLWAAIGVAMFWVAAYIQLQHGSVPEALRAEEFPAGNDALMNWA
jgi:hypothetical protein